MEGNPLHFVPSAHWVQSFILHWPIRTSHGLDCQKGGFFRAPGSNPLLRESEVVWCAKLWASLWESAGKLGNRATVSEQLLSPDWKEWEEWPAMVNEWPLPQSG